MTDTPDTPRPHPVSDALALVAAELAVTDEELRILEAQKTAEDALGIDLDAIQQQSQSDLVEAEADRLRMEALQQCCATAQTEAELLALVEEGKALVARAEARQERRDRHEDALRQLEEVRARVLR